MKKLISIMLIICCLSVIVCASMIGCTPKDERIIKLTEVTHSVFYAPLYVAINNGYFEDNDVIIELSNGGGADNCMTSILSGGADIGLMGPEAAIYVYNEGREDHPVIFGQLTRKDGSFIMARQPDNDFSWDKLKGKEIIGGRKGGVPAMAIEYALTKNNLISPTDINLRYDIKFDLIGAAFEGGTGDYCTMFEPAASNMQKANKAYIVASVGEESGNMPFTAFMASKSYINKNSEKINGFVNAIGKAMKFVEESTPEEIAKVIAPSFADTDITTLAMSIKLYKEIDAYSYSPVMEKADFEHLQDVIIQANVMTKRASYDKLVDNSFANNIKKA